VDYENRPGLTAMRRARRVRQVGLPPIQVWHEPIDNSMGAVLAYCEAVQHGAYHAASAFLLMDAAMLPPRNWRRDWENAGRARLGKYVADHHGGRLPFVRAVRSASHETEVP
jgi:hypothetical protein